MRYQFLTIEGDTVLLLDVSRQVVVRFPIEDYAQDVDPDPLQRHPAPYVPRKPNRNFPLRGYNEHRDEQIRRGESGHVPVGETVNEDIPQDIQPETPRKVPVRQSIVPPHLRGIFLPADAPGADVEKRVV